jgi:uncharacterized membrane protein YGL010W
LQSQGFREQGKEMRNWFFEQIAMYSAYHRNTKNQLTHHIGVPMIVFSIMVIAATVNVATFESGPLTLAGVLMTLLLLMYIWVVPLTGVVAVLIYGTLLYFAERIAAQGMETALTVFISLFVLGWIIQFVGHIFEKRKPALFDNLLQIFMAPSFLIAEILFMLGLEEGLKQQIADRIHKYLPEHEKDAG